MRYCPVILRGVYLERSRKAQNDSALMTSNLEVTHDVETFVIIQDMKKIRYFQYVFCSIC